MSTLSRLLTVCVCLLAGTGSAFAFAADCVWTGLSPVNGNWSDGRNWTTCHTGGTPTAGDTITFPNGAARPANTNNIFINAGADTVTILGTGAGNVAWTITSQITLKFKSITVTSPNDGTNHGPTLLGQLQPLEGGTITTHVAAGGASTLTIGAEINLQGQTVTFNLDAPVNMTGVISDNCPGQPTALIKDGPETLSLSATNHYCGATLIRAGLAEADAPKAFGNSSPADDVVAANALPTGDALTQVLAPAFVAIKGGIDVTDSIVLAGRLNGFDVGIASVSGDLLYSAGASMATDSRLVFTGRVANAGAPARITSDGGTVQLNGVAAFQLNGTTAGTTYDQLDLISDLDIGVNATLELSRGFNAPAGSTFTIANLALGRHVTGTFANAPEGGTVLVNGQPFHITYHGGDGNDVVITAADEAPKPTYFLSEGATGDFFDEDILIANPNGQAAPVTLTFSKENGEQVVATRSVPALGRLTVHVDQIAGLQATSASAQVRSDNRLPLVVERSMFWDASYYAGSTGSSVDQPGPDWFFAEGSQGFFQTFLLVINPNPTPTQVSFTFLRENDTPVVKTITVGATSRLTLDCATIAEVQNRSFGVAVHAAQPIMAERSMYFGTVPGRLWSGGTESAGVTAPSTHWFLAEGATGGFFYTFVLLSNPQDADAHVTLQYLLDTGDTVTVQKVVPAHTRLTTNIGAENDARLHAAAVSTVVTSDQPLIAERSMYWPTAVQPFGEGHNSFGVVSAGTTWGLAEGRIGGPHNFHTYILLANPQTTAAQVTVTFVRENGAPVVKQYTVPATSRFNIDSFSVAELHDESFGAFVQVTNNVPIIVERSMYWDTNTVTFSGGTNATGIALADGSIARP